MVVCWEANGENAVVKGHGVLELNHGDVGLVPLLRVVVLRDLYPLNLFTNKSKS